ncbi:MAG: V-type ATP synthase subunit F [Anaerolineae bacterium]|nr:V-type ATP synthase subunit F [Anaerolineae bacterium]
MKILAIGHPDAILGFSLAGIPGQVATTAEDVKHALATALATPDVGLILITEDAARLIEEQVNQLMLRGTIPLVIEIPAPLPSGAPLGSGTLEEGRSGKLSLSEMIQNTIGVRI